MGCTEPVADGILARTDVHTQGTAKGVLVGSFVVVGTKVGLFDGYKFSFSLDWPDCRNKGCLVGWGNMLIGIFEVLIG